MAALLAILAFLKSGPVNSGDWLLLAGLIVLALLSQLLDAEVPGRQSYYPHTVFFFAGVLLLPPSLFVMLVVVPHVVEWTKERIFDGPHLRSWYIQPFNIAAHIISGIAAYSLYHALGGGPVSAYTLTTVIAVSGAVLAYVLINHALVGMVLVLARGLTWKQSGILESDSLVPDLVLSYLGYVVAVLVGLSPWVALPALAPLALTHRVFVLFRMKQDAFTDSKSGLWNSRHFNAILTAELDRARRFSRDLSVVVVELDCAKEVANAYGQVALDRLIGGMGGLLKEGTRQYDVCARMEGTRFVILLPETNPFELLIVARRLRNKVKEAEFEVETTENPIHITASMGVACFPGDAIDPDRLIECAEEAAEYAASRGKSTIACAPDVPRQESQIKGNLVLTGEVHIPVSDTSMGFANPALRNPTSMN